MKPKKNITLSGKEITYMTRREFFEVLPASIDFKESFERCVIKPNQFYMFDYFMNKYIQRDKFREGASGLEIFLYNVERYNLVEKKEQ
jgi:hypothetical protein